MSACSTDSTGGTAYACISRRGLCKRGLPVPVQASPDNTHQPPKPFLRVRATRLRQAGLVPPSQAARIVGGLPGCLLTAIGKTSIQHTGCRRTHTRSTQTGRRPIHTRLWEAGVIEAAAAKKSWRSTRTLAGSTTKRWLDS